MIFKCREGRLAGWVPKDALRTEALVLVAQAPKAAGTLETTEGNRDLRGSPHLPVAWRRPLGCGQALVPGGSKGHYGQQLPQAGLLNTSQTNPWAHS